MFYCLSVFDDSCIPRIALVCSSVRALVSLFIRPSICLFVRLSVPLLFMNATAMNSFLVHLNYCHHLASVVCRPLSVVCRL
jgi:hypothetical protein